ncbi:type II toxin-antitoxin system Phd/YefM family antitoxin [Leptolyngbya sp. NIES-2104]|uniref:type II toxin-antitoxin system Phd/YefM family antitoxin n=1 Tax=Leptolyngbya sp. NIES-2104 TaxID=1552121 RepID=UPI0006EC6132|nr:type II toxin-antitoxin system Phd/YefM family antitoxin [Leptolyngbya sp. NIES-2104]GAP95959.1 prevent-host-death protein [Leptolyngbya sp. NIES-2104]
MQQFSIEEMKARSQDVLETATSEPVILLDQSQPSYVVLSIQNYQQLLDRLTELEDQALGKLAEVELQNSSMVGSATFVAELEQLATLDKHDR